MSIIGGAGSYKKGNKCLVEYGVEMIMIGLLVFMNVGLDSSAQSLFFCHHIYDHRHFQFLHPTQSMQTLSSLSCPACTYHYLIQCLSKGAG